MDIPLALYLGMFCFVLIAAAVAISDINKQQGLKQ